MIIDMPLDDLKAWLKQYDRNSNVYWSLRWEIKVHLRFVDQGIYKFIIQRSSQQKVHILPAPARIEGTLERIGPLQTDLNYEIHVTTSYLRRAVQYTLVALAIAIPAIVVGGPSIDAVVGFIAFGFLINLWAEFLINCHGRDRSIEMIRSIADEVEGLPSTSR
ncbi:MAG: hypothetical protein L0154_02500 [Chloroflexi bacterium]|nr:hypothetical protein [Chloroflexota bacterium]